jgi:anti-anti-sigma factor
VPFTIDVVTDGDEGCRARARGELDTAAAGTLCTALHDPARPRRRFVNLDMSAVTFCDAGGLAALLTAHQDFAARGGMLVLFHVPPRVQRIMGIVGLDVVLCSPPAPEEAPRDRKRHDAPPLTHGRRRPVAVVDALAKEA